LIGAELSALIAAVKEIERSHKSDIESVAAIHRDDARNLLHYLALRQGDVRHLQRWLGERGLSSLGRCEPHVLATLESVQTALEGTAPDFGPAVGFKEGRAALDRNTDTLFGPRPRGRVTRIMVTLPTQAASDYSFVRQLVEKGMNVARINGAHDAPLAWKSMIGHVRKASAEVGRPCCISMDLPGPKMRTGPLLAGPATMKVKPQRDARGMPVAPARVRFVGADARGLGAELVVDPRWIEHRRLGDEILIRDSRDRERRWVIVDTAADSCTAEAWDTTYVETGGKTSSGDDSTIIEVSPRADGYHLLKLGDTLVLQTGQEPVRAWHHGDPGTARIGCDLGPAFQLVRTRQRVIFDDGKLTGTVVGVRDDEISVRIEKAKPKGTKLREGKGINLPDTDLQASAVTGSDLQIIEIAAAHADMVAMSFLRSESDVDILRQHLDSAGGSNLGIVLKIETTAAFARLPQIMLHAMRSDRAGVMIARGDLAVEAGYERLAEVQEEILWLSEAAHLPVIWATEVLDHLARTGTPSRAEITDAAMAQRAECVMLNKGPYIDTAITVLDDILRRMSRHQRKKAALLQTLHSWS
jgi:pyruvate kinase